MPMPLRRMAFLPAFVLIIVMLVPTPLAAGDTFCGTAGNDSATRDTAWYRFTVETDQAVTVRGRAEVALRVGVVAALCDDPTYVFWLHPPSDYIEYSASGDLSPDAYALVGTTLGSADCGARYKATLECESGCRADFDSNRVVNTADVGAFLSQYFIDVAGGFCGG